MGAVLLPYPDPELRGPSFVLRRFREDDYAAALALTREPGATTVPPLPADDPGTVVELYERYRLDGGLLHLVIADPDDDRYLGELMVAICDVQMGEFGCGLVPEARRRGIATEALSMFVTWCAEHLDLCRLQVVVATDNRPALDLAGRVGFRKEGVLRSYGYHDGGRFDVAMLSMLTTECPRGARQVGVRAASAAPFHPVASAG